MFPIGETCSQLQVTSVLNINPSEVHKGSPIAIFLKQTIFLPGQHCNQFPKSCLTTHCCNSKLSLKQQSREKSYHTQYCCRITRVQHPIASPAICPNLWWIRLNPATWFINLYHFLECIKTTTATWRIREFRSPFVTYCLEKNKTASKEAHF